MKIQAYIYHKRAEKYSDCQDYFKIDLQNNRIAVADGMSQCIYPQWWAKILVNAYLEKGKIPTTPEELRIYQQDWQSQLQTEIDKREAAGKNPWRLKNAFAEKSGAGSTICGFSWKGDNWESQCIGDSSIIEVSKDYDIKIESSQEGEFGNNPDYLDSFRNGRGSVKEFQGSFKDVILILLVTDPFSELFYKHHRDRQFIKDRLTEIEALSDHKSYCDLIERWRDDFEMHNDDSTLIVIKDFLTSTNSAEQIYSLEELCTEEAKVYGPEEVSPEAKEYPIKGVLTEFKGRAKATEDANDKAVERAKAAEEARDKAIERAKAAEEARDKAIERAKAAEEARDKAEERAKVAEKARDKAEERAKAAEEARDKAEERETTTQSWFKNILLGK